MAKNRTLHLVLMLGITTSFNLQAQESVVLDPKVSLPESTEANRHAKVFTDENGNLFWNLSLPVYLSISSNPDGKDAHRLKSVKNAKMKEYTNPMYFDGHGVHYIRHLDYENPVPESEEAFVINVDGYKPVSKARFIDAPKFEKGGKVFYGKNLKVHIKGNDEMSGIDQTLYSINNSEYSLYSNSINFSEEKSYTFSYYSMDNVGNVEETKKVEFEVDLTAPVTQMTISGDKLDDIVSPRSELSMELLDNNSGVKISYLKFDEQEENVYSVPFKLYNLQEGEHTVSYYSVDNVDNQEQLHTYKFYMDRTAPEVSSEVVGDFHRINGKTFISERSNVKLNAEDNKAGVDKIYYVLNGGVEQVYSGPFAISAGQGKQALVFRAVDKVNNSTKFKADSNIGNGSVYLDKTPPIVSHLFSGAQFLTRDTIFITSETKVILKTADYESGAQKITYQLDKGTTNDYQSPLLVAGRGFHQVNMTGYDNVNNTKENSFFFIVDNEGPEIFWHLSIDKIGTQRLEGKESSIPVYPKHALLYLAATDAMVGTDKIYYSVDGAAEKLYLGPIKTSLPGLRTVKVRAVDKLGNVVENELIEYVVQ